MGTFLFMTRFFIKTPSFIPFILPNLIWKIKTQKPVVYLTFDDGPIPEVTPWVLDLLNRYNAKATFFCIGENLYKHKEIAFKILEKNHTLANHTYHHLNGWKTDTTTYLENITKAEVLLKEIYDSNAKIFRPPYGKITPKQVLNINKLGYKIIMWSVLSYDFNEKITVEKCIKNVLNNVKNGSIIVFHDSIKAKKNLKETLPVVLEQLSKRGFYFDKL